MSTSIRSCMVVATFVAAALSACGSTQPVAEQPSGATQPSGTTTTTTAAATPTSTTTDERHCGSRGLAPCAQTEYCDFPDTSQCGANDAGGVCRARPEACTDEVAPVCGCDGHDYTTACDAAVRGVDARVRGTCAEAARLDAMLGQALS